MSLFKCTKCGFADNTATSGYWLRKTDKDGHYTEPPLCSLCDPAIAKWHDKFPRREADKFYSGVDSRGYLVGWKGPVPS